MGAEQGEGVFRHTSVGLGGGSRLRHWRASSGGCREPPDDCGGARPVGEARGVWEARC